MRRASHNMLVAALASALLASETASAQTMALTTRMQRFFFRGALGIGYGAFGSETSVGSLAIRGAGAMGNFAIGVNLVRGLAVHVDACAMSLVNPTFSVNGVGNTSANDATTTTSIIGGGLTWSDRGGLLWVSLSGGVSVIGIETGVVTRTSSGYGLTSLGWGLNLLAGHDWPIIYNWRVGAALHAIYSQAKDQPGGPEAPTWQGFGGGVSLTVSER